MTKEANNPLDLLLGRQLSSVEFVRDYVQLRFDGPSINAYVWPIIHTGAKSYVFGDRDYRNVLCGFIGLEVASTSLACDVAEIVFSEIGSMRFDFNATDDPEAMTFDYDSNRWWVW